MENCGKSRIEPDKPIDFSFIFKDDKPVVHVEGDTVMNPQEPLRIEEKVR